MAEQQETNGNESTQNGGNGSVEFKTPLFSARIGGKDFQLRDFIGVATFVVVALVAFGGWQMGTAMTAVLKDLSLAQREQVDTQREMNCLIALPQERRELEYMSPHSFCKRMAR